MAALAVIVLAGVVVFVAAKQYAEVKGRQRNIAGFWGGFFP